MSRTSLAGAGDHEVRRLARTLVRGVRELDLAGDLDAAHLPWERSGPWDVRLFSLSRHVGADGRVCVHDRPHWVLAVRARDERARWEHLPGLLTVLRLAPGTHPVVAPDATPAGEPLWWVWRPADARVRHAPDKGGIFPHPDALEAVRAAVEATHAFLRAREADQAAARAAAEELARRDVEEAAGRFRVVAVDAPWSSQLAHPEPAEDPNACSACGVPTWDGCGYELAAFTGPGRWRPRGLRLETEELRLCPDCQADTDKLVAELFTRHGTGCCLHVALDDHNLEDDSIAFVKGWARDKGHTLCELIADRYAAFDLAERRARCGLRPDGSAEAAVAPEVLPAPAPRPAEPPRMRGGGGGGLMLALLLGLGALGPSPDDPR